jgi:hypothetical protein
LAAAAVAAAPLSLLLSPPQDLQTIIRQVHAMRSTATRQQPASSGDWD